MVSKKITIINPSGLSMEPAGAFCDEAMRFQSTVKFRYKNGEANAKSMLSVLGACLQVGDEIELICEGEDEAEALDALCTKALKGFGQF